jgi:hypothetical protein
LETKNKEHGPLTQGTNGQDKDQWLESLEFILQSVLKDREPEKVNLALEKVHQELHPLERDGDGGQGQLDHERRRPHLDLRLGGDALRGGVQPFFRGRTEIFPATWFISRATPRRAFMRGRFSKAGWTSGICRISGRNSPRAAGCRRIRIRI